MIYDTKIIDVITNSLTMGFSTIDNFDYTSKRFCLNVANIKIELVVENGVRDGIIHLMNPAINMDYIKVWKSYAPGHFMCRDFKKDARDKDGKSPYYIIKYKYGEITMKALVRYLFEVDENIGSDSDIRKMIEDYGDFEFEGRYYAVIKICNMDKWGDGWITPESNKIDLLHQKTLEYEEFSDEDNEDEDEDEDDFEDDYGNNEDDYEFEKPLI